MNRFHFSHTIVISTLLSLSCMVTASTCYAATPATAETTIDHPLEVPLRIAYSRFAYVSKHVKDYSCVLVRRERVNGKLGSYEYLSAKIRHEQLDGQRVVIPFSVYLRVLGPERIKDREILYIAGRNNGELLARNGGKRFSYVTLSLNPFGGTAMRGNRYPITEIGIKNLCRRLIEVGEESKQNDADSQQCRVLYYRQAKVGDRLCTCIQVEHPERRDNLRFHRVRIFLDDELHIPIRYEAYDWPTSPDGEPPLLEEYTYLKLRLNVGYTDEDFDRSNPAYGFP